MKPLTLIDKAFLLKKTALFSTLDIDQLLVIADKMDVEEYKKGKEIFEMGQDGNRLYIIAEGTVLIKNQQMNLAELTLHDTFGDESVLSEKSRSYTALCMTDTLLLTLSQPHFLAILSECPSVAASLLESYASITDFRKKD